MKLETREEAYSRICRELREGLRKKQLEDRAKAVRPPKPKLEATVLEFPLKLSEQELIRRRRKSSTKRGRGGSKNVANSKGQQREAVSADRLTATITREVQHDRGCC